MRRYPQEGLSRARRSTSRWIEEMVRGRPRRRDVQAAEWRRRCSGSARAIVCRVIQRLGLLPALEPARRPAEAARRLWIVDGTPIPVRGRGVGASGRNYRFSANVQVIIDADTRVVVATSRPGPGSKADAHVWRDSGLPALCEGVTTLADGAYLNTGLVVPAPKTGRKAPAAGPGGRQRRTSAHPRPHRVRLRPDEELQDFARLPTEGSRSPPRRRTHA
ncbi:transposase [Nonomuraea sp. JJY05]|uniref:transposase n=1 Tax=Nonomuraea sp. JJY05 TaxID=3350255 RepID=UPI00373EE69C